MSQQKVSSLQSKVAVITRAARGIGRASTVALAQEGADIVGVDICSPYELLLVFNPQLQAN